MCIPLPGLEEDGPQKDSDYEFVVYGGDRPENRISHQASVSVQSSVGFSGIIEVFYHSRVDCQQHRETSQDQESGGGCLRGRRTHSVSEAFLRELVTTHFVSTLPTVFPSDNGGKTVGRDARRLSQSA